MSASPQTLSSAEPAFEDFAGSAAATVATLGLIAALAWVISEPSSAPTPEPIVFAPGALLALGSDADRPPGGDAAPALPEPAVQPDAPAPESTDEPDAPVDRQDGAPDAITDVAKPAAPRPPRPAGGRPRPRPPSPAGLLPQPPGRPGVGPGAGGKPTGSADGFSDRLREGDAWATSVLSALSATSVGTFGGDLPAGTLRFALTICPDGRIKRIKRLGGSTITKDGADRVVHALEVVKLPKPPKAVRDRMGGKCQALDYKFAWAADEVR